MTLSIIIPAYNAEPYIEHLIQRLKPQINDDVEVIVVDDGSDFPYLAPFDWVQVIRQKNKGLAGARNTGLKKAKGDIIAFIDADDLVSENYVSYIQSRASEDWDYMDLSWRSLENSKFIYKLRSDQDKLENPSACTRVFKRSFIGNLRFNEKRDVAEDEDFTRRLQLDKAKRVCATEFMYYYRTETPNSLSKQYREGRTKTKRIVYYLPKVITRDDVENLKILEEIKKDSEENEVVVMTNRNEVPEIELYAKVLKPQQTWAHELKGAQTNLISIRREPMETQVIIYMKHPGTFGGREVFILNFCKQMCKHYDIVVLFDIMKADLQNALIPYVRVIQCDKSTMYFCDSVIINSIHDQLPSNIKAKKVIQMVHGCKSSTYGKLPTSNDITVCVSNAVKDSFGEETKDAIVIKNLTAPGSKAVKKDSGKTLKLITASRLNVDTRYEDKGSIRMEMLADILRLHNIDFTWTVYSESRMFEDDNITWKKPVSNDQIKQEIANSDYLVQLSSAEAFCYSVVEALEIGTAVLVHEIPVFKELKIVDGDNGYYLPFNMDFDVDKLRKVPKFKYTYNNGLIVSKWKKLLGNTKPKGDYIPEKMVMVQALIKYKDMSLGRVVSKNECVMMTEDRAKVVQDAGYGIVKEG